MAPSWWVGGLRGAGGRTEQTAVLLLLLCSLSRATRLAPGLEPDAAFYMETEEERWSVAPERQLRVTLSRLAGPRGLGPALVILTSGTAGPAALGLLTSAQLLPDGGRCLAFWVGKSGGFLAFAGIPAPPGLEGGRATHTHTNTHACAHELEDTCPRIAHACAHTRIHVHRCTLTHICE